MTPDGSSLSRRLATVVGSWSGEAKAVVWLLGGDVATRAASQVAIILTARMLGPSEYGTLAAGLAAFSLVTVLADLGVGDSAVQRLTRRLGGEETFWRNVAPVRLAISVPLLPGGLAIAMWSSNGSFRTMAVLLAVIPFASLLSSRVIAARISETFGAAAGWTALLGVSQAFGALGAAIVLARTGVSAAIGIALALAFSGLVAARRLRWHRPEPQVALGWIRRGVPFAVTAGAVAFYTRADRIVVAAIVGAGAAGEYAAAYNVVMIAAIAGTALHAAILPRLLHENREGTVPKWGARVLAVACLTVPVAILLMMFSTRIMTALYGPNFSSSASVLRVLSPLVVLYIVNPFLASSLVAARRQRTLARIALVNASVAGATFPLLTSWFGTVGTAAASVSIELLSTTLVIHALRRRGLPTRDSVAVPRAI